MAPIIPPSRPTARNDGFPSISASVIVAGAASAYRLLTIKGYSRTKSAVPNGEHVESRPFRVAGHTWAILYFPNGDRPETADYISIYLLLKDDVADGVLVQYHFSFIDQVDKQSPSYMSNLTPRRFLAIANSYKGVWGYKNLVKREILERSGRLKDDCFMVRCDMVVAKELSMEDAVVPTAVVPPADWPQHFLALLLGGKGADVMFLVGDKTFAAHRCVLAARSPVFDVMLFGPMKEGTTTESYIRIDDMLLRVFESLLHFIYTHSRPETKGQDEVGVMMAQHLLEAADRYGMERLKLICEDRLCRHIDVSTVATTLALAEQHRCQSLKETCFEFLKSSKTRDAVMATDGFQHLAKSCPSALFELMSKLAAR